MQEQITKLFVEFNYPINEPDKVELKSNIKHHLVSDIICDFLQSQTGKGADSSPPQDRDIYFIRLELDLTNDSFTSFSNCGNLGLRDGILMDIIRRLPSSEAKEL